MFSNNAMGRPMPDQCKITESIIRRQEDIDVFLKKWVPHGHMFRLVREKKKKKLLEADSSRRRRGALEGLEIQGGLFHFF